MPGKSMKRANGTGSVFKLKGRRRKPWAVKVTAGFDKSGKQKFLYLGYYTKKEEASATLLQHQITPLTKRA